MKPGGLDSLIEQAIASVRMLDDWTNHNETQFTGWGDGDVPPAAEFWRVKSGQALKALNEIKLHNDRTRAPLPNAQSMEQYAEFVRKAEQNGGILHYGFQQWKRAKAANRRADIIDRDRIVFTEEIRLNSSIATPDYKARYEWLRDWYLRDGLRKEIHEFGHIKKTTPEIFDAGVDAGIKKS